MIEIVTIDAVGSRGDGVAHGPSGPIYVPFAVAGERIAIERHGACGRIVEVIAPSPERATPPCRHFGTCGGCALQMLSLDAGRRLKRDFVRAALAREGVIADVAETVGVHRASRRRAVFTALRVGKAVRLGYNERQTNRIVDLAECPILAGPLAARLDGIRGFVAPFAAERKPARVTVLMARNGLDISIETAIRPSPKAVARLASEAAVLGVARLSCNGEPVLTLAEPLVEMSDVCLSPPPGAFLQASAEAERIMAGIAVEHLAGARRLADLFCGLGGFAIALARSASVRAVEASQPALDALSQALRGAQGLKPIETERRDLFAFPLTPRELAGLDGLVFDPPRAGAKAQAQAIAASAVPRVVAVSCNPASFARDARTLIAGGYRLDRVVPVDQFVYSTETEVVGLFRR